MKPQFYFLKPTGQFILLILFLILSNSLKAQNKPIDDLDISITHPRIFWNVELLEKAKNWYLQNPFEPTRKEVLSIYDGSQAIELAFAYLVSENMKSDAERRDYARRAIEWAKLALQEIESENFENGAGTCNRCRWYGDGLFLVLDWCFAELTNEEWNQFYRSIIDFIPLWNTADWGGIDQPRSNFFHGYTRNSIYAGILLYHENRSFAIDMLNHGLIDRWNVFKNYANQGGISGIQSEGTSYNVAIQRYHLYTGVSLINAGYDYIGETDYFRRTIGFNLYNVAPDRAYVTPNASQEDSFWLPFPYGDAAVFMNVNEWSQTYRNGYAHFMLLQALIRKDDGKLSQYAKAWVDKLEFFNYNYPPYKFVEAVTSDLPKASLSELPLDYFAPYGGHTPYGYTRNSWEKDATAIHIQLGKPPLGGHEHMDAGSFTIARGNRYLIIPPSGRGYGSSWKIPNYDGDRTQGIDVQNTLAKNTILFGKKGSTAAGHTTENVDRLMSHDYFFYAANDLTPAYKNYDNPTFSSNVNVKKFERETIFIKPLETFVVFDRTESVENENQIKTSLLHTQGAPVQLTQRRYSVINNDHEAIIDILLPTNREISIINETQVEGCGHCRDREDDAHRIQIENSNEGIVYFLNVIQTKATKDQHQISTNLQETDTTFLISIKHETKGSAVIEFEKGIASTKGRIGYDPIESPKQLTSLPEKPQAIDVTNDGPTWYELGTLPPPTGTPDIIEEPELIDVTSLNLEYRIENSTLFINFNNNQIAKTRVRFYAITGARIYDSKAQNVTNGNIALELPILAKKEVYFLKISTNMDKKENVFKVFIDQ
ncbi:hypothetical protein U6A24_02515 [Aquimarina gracilis]|uniref:Heparinase II/III-like protein n=1 Tax=Aquimarina gracilis TaxID=874422 RepID=A0ABU5ZRP5_9FLAO|nr:hypothetical protein [Aquimarina gracilis]MEB3344313.1 hypothetical protein [Aquimarina gracilis]